MIEARNGATIVRKEYSLSGLTLADPIPEVVVLGNKLQEFKGGIAVSDSTGTTVNISSAQNTTLTHTLVNDVHRYTATGSAVSPNMGLQIDVSELSSYPGPYSYEIKDGDTTIISNGDTAISGNPCFALKSANMGKDLDASVYSNDNLVATFKFRVTIDPQEFNWRF